MKSVDKCTQELIQSILESDEYRRYSALRDQIKAMPELRKKLSEFRRHVYEVQNSEQVFDLYKEQENLGKFAAEFRQNELVDEYLKAELRICRELQWVALMIADAVDLDLEGVVG